MPMFRSANGGTYTVSGVPVVVDDLADAITGSIAGLLVAALLVMARGARAGVPRAAAAAAAGVALAAARSRSARCRCVGAR